MRLSFASRTRARIAQLALIGAGTCALALALQGPVAQAAQTAPACRGTFTVLHNDRVGQMAVPRGAYAVRATGVSCATAGKLIDRFLDEADGELPSGRTLEPQTGTSCSAARASRWSVVS